jgi:hypothetical protein
MTIFVIVPMDDAQARVAGQYGRQVAARFPRSTDIQIVDALSRAAIDRLLAHGGHVLYFGHGERDALVSRRLRWLPWGTQRLCDDKNLPAEGRVVIAIACWSADTLGRNLTEGNGVEAYLGWPDRFAWPSGSPEPTWEAVTNAIEILAQGGTVESCGNELRAGLHKAHDHYREHLAWQPLAAMEAFYLAGRLFIGGNTEAQLA